MPNNLELEIKIKQDVIDAYNANGPFKFMKVIGSQDLSKDKKLSLKAVGVKRSSGATGEEVLTEVDLGEPCPMPCDGDGPSLPTPPAEGGTTAAKKISNGTRSGKQ